MDKGPKPDPREVASSWMSSQHLQWPKAPYRDSTHIRATRHLHGHLTSICNGLRALLETPHMPARRGIVMDA
jgi:hypothetical protein